MTEREGETISAGNCPDCHSRGFVLGPMGGINLNVECANVHCRARFNVALYAGRVQYAQRIEKHSEGGPEWPSEPEVGR